MGLLINLKYEEILFSFRSFLEFSYNWLEPYTTGGPDEAK